MPPKAPPEPSEAEIILNRTNVALARSQRLIQSWLPPKPDDATRAGTSHNGAPEATNPDDDEEDFRGLDETVGLGAKRKADVDGLSDGLRRRRIGGSDDRLLEQILGKKGAAEKRKREGAKSAGKEQGAGKVKAAGQGKQESARDVDAGSDSEEEGRAAVFKSRKQKRGSSAPQSAPEPVEERDGVEDETGGKDGGRDHSAAVAKAPAEGPDDDDEEQRPAKRKTGSYLDELLAQKANKKPKKKKKKGPA